MSELLATSAAVAQWLAEADGNAGRVQNDPLIAALIAQASRFVLNYLSRASLLPRIYSERYDGTYGSTLLLRNWPVLSVSSFVSESTIIPLSVGIGKSGYLLAPWDGSPPGQMQALDISGYAFCKGQQNVAVTYTAGYQVTGESFVIPSSGPITVGAPFGAWTTDQGVTDASGVAFTKVTSPPAARQYALAVTSGQYTFNAADQGTPVLISYGYIPADVAQATTEIVGERYRYRRRIGEASKSIGGEVVAFSLKDMQDYVAAVLQPYRRVAMI